jgi:hypothetical protein
MYVLGDDEGLVLKALEVTIDQQPFIKIGGVVAQQQSMRKLTLVEKATRGPWFRGFESMPSGRK